jgi:hypothetical protein
LLFAFRNLVDVAPFVFDDNGGTTHASMYTKFGETSVRITFAAANAAFGGGSWLTSVSEGAQLSIYDGETLLDSRELGANAGAFLGYVLTGGVTAISVRFTSVTDQSGRSGEGFGYGNLAGVVAGSGPTPAPVPGTAGLLALGLGAVWSARRCRA